MPTNFVPSFIDELWFKERKNLPSSAFRAQVDPKTMLWKDVRECKTEDMTADAKKGYRPDARPIESTIACLISLVEAQGVPLPQLGDSSANAKKKSTFRDDHIVKRAIRIAIDRTHKATGRRELIHNAVQIPADWAKSDEDIWRFDKTGKTLRDVLFRTTAPDGLSEGDVGIILELVVYVKAGDDASSATEMSCGWCELPLADLFGKKKHVLDIKGGSPTAAVEIDAKDLRTNRSGLKALSKAFAGGVAKLALTVEIKPLSQLP